MTCGARCPTRTQRPGDNQPRPRIVHQKVMYTPRQRSSSSVAFASATASMHDEHWPAGPADLGDEPRVRHGAERRGAAGPADRGRPSSTWTGAAEGLPHASPAPRPARPTRRRGLQSRRGTLPGRPTRPSTRQRSSRDGQRDGQSARDGAPHVDGRRAVGGRATTLRRLSTPCRACLRNSRTPGALPGAGPHR